MWKNLFHNKVFQGTLAGLTLVLAFPPIEIVPLVFLSPFFLNLLVLNCKNSRQGFFYGFIISLVIMMGAFYWVVYVIHVFGNLPWAVAVLLYIAFCGIGALNFPIFVGIAVWLKNKFKIHESNSKLQLAWFLIGWPALFTIIEFLIPKLFPWYICHALYETRWMTQIVEFTGCTFLSFSIYSLSSACGLWYYRRSLPNLKPSWTSLTFPLGLWILIIGYSIYYLQSKALTERDSKVLRVGIVQANIGSLEKLASRRGIGAKVRYVVDKYTELTTQLVKSGAELDLILWPETAMPFYLVGDRSYTQEIHQKVKAWNIPLISGGYAPHPSRYFTDYNAAYLLDPLGKESLEIDIYRKNILLAFGEYMPFGELYPKIYEWFPQIANFKRGETQNPFTLNDGTRLGVTICYEAIVPSFYRKVARNRVQAIVNLTNDSWFGPTSEPYQHGALSVFRAIEMRAPLLRSTNTGLSFVVDITGKMSEPINVFSDGTLVREVRIPDRPIKTFYLEYGEWFVGLCFALLTTLLILTKRYAPIPV